MQSKVKSKVELNLEVNSFSDAGTKEIKVSSVMFLDRRLTFVWTIDFVDICLMIFVPFNVLLSWQGKYVEAEPLYRWITVFLSSSFL